MKKALSIPVLSGVILLVCASTEMTHSKTSLKSDYFNGKDTTFSATNIYSYPERDFTRLILVNYRNIIYLALIINIFINFIVHNTYRLKFHK